jgi:hypothetical protein
METESMYLNRRFSEEREAAIHAEHPKARKAHLLMAEYFETRLRVADAQTNRSAFRLVGAGDGATAA